MGEAKRRKKLLGDKYGTPEYSNKRELLTGAKIAEDFYMNPQRDRWIDIIQLFIHDNWHPGFLSGFSDISSDLQKAATIQAELSAWGERNFNKERDVPKGLDILNKTFTSFDIIADILNTNKFPFKIDFKKCKTESQLLEVLFLLCLSIHSFFLNNEGCSTKEVV